jgi:hypothetical protein
VWLSNDHSIAPSGTDPRAIPPFLRRGWIYKEPNFPRLSAHLPRNVSRRHFPPTASPNLNFGRSSTLKVQIGHSRKQVSPFLSISVQVTAQRKAVPRCNVSQLAQVILISQHRFINCVVGVSDSTDNPRPLPVS